MTEGTKYPRVTPDATISAPSPLSGVIKEIVIRHKNRADEVRIEAPDVRGLKGLLSLVIMDDKAVVRRYEPPVLREASKHPLYHNINNYIYDALDSFDDILICEHHMDAVMEALVEMGLFETPQPSDAAMAVNTDYQAARVAERYVDHEGGPKAEDVLTDDELREALRKKAPPKKPAPKPLHKPIINSMTIEEQRQAAAMAYAKSDITWDEYQTTMKWLEEQDRNK